MLCVEFGVPEAAPDLAGTFQSAGDPCAAWPRGQKCRQGLKGSLALAQARYFS